MQHDSEDIPVTPPAEVVVDTTPSLEEEAMRLRSENAELRSLLAEQKENSITDQLWLWVLDCKLRRNAYWNQYYRYQRYNNILSTPLTLIASATGVTSIAQLGYEGASIQIAVAVLGVLSTAMTAYQRYFNWGQKAIHCRDIGKRYGLLARRAEMQINLFMTKRITFDVLVEFMEAFRKELDAVQSEAEDMPVEILKKKVLADAGMSSNELKNLAMQESDDERDDNGRVNGRKIMFSKMAAK